MLISSSNVLISFSKNKPPTDALPISKSTKYIFFSSNLTFCPVAHDKANLIAFGWFILSEINSLIGNTQLNLFLHLIDQLHQ